MRKILVVGAGQSGLQLALGLLAEDYDVTLIAPRGPEEVRAGRVMSTQCLFGPALRRERRHGLAFWDERAPEITGVGVRVTGRYGGADPEADWVGHLDEPAQSVDQRLKLAAWTELFARNGGRLVLRRVGVPELEGLGAEHDLTIVAAGRGELAELFPRNERRSPFTEPQRVLSLAYVTGAEPHPAGGVLGRTAIPGAGELITLPTLSLAGACQAVMVEAVPGGPLDRPLGREASAEDLLAGLLDVLRAHAPREHERFARARPADPMAALRGGYTPTVREPVARLAGGTPVLGMADSVVSNDPITAQGANMASLCADVYRRAIVDHGARPFDENFMRSAFAAYWRHARQVTAWSRVMLSGPDHVWELYRLADRHQPTADRFANSFGEPGGLIDWFLHPERAMEYADAVRGSAAESSRVPIS
ncbi:alanine-phosphoribitol ligase [Nocardiopsis terrae]|uniref:2-polyprenyl-6-methoxyphenol hydroxylase-like FAD-dependent oxidoreductase n=1 Tax=Nocardiopsis terrae TaxID=372655 RepID=A0ABR9HF93_9ACTN|nr:styrene monooxygenase/indole monooxygenase family protein [Nocardiopsis terrae]MBE1457704.1 2-polyprenyl-6-methoxyphenol hydroxylase-like FAD-dependent oxidoreductase [Nocardiopsis terrae]GHC84682.1 alanine-phosphoribitol ligase [Nocardiopsis terrae]